MLTRDTSGASPKRSALVATVIFFLSGIAGCTPCRAPQKIMDDYLRHTTRTPSGIYVVDGDLPVNTDRALRAHYDRYYCAVDQYRLDPAVPKPTTRPIQHTSGPASPFLTIHQHQGADSRWSIAKRRALTYCVDAGFGADHGRVVSAMAAAAQDWAGAADVAFQYSSSLDNSCSEHSAVVFTVEYLDTGEFLASAFFPNYPRTQRVLYVDRAALSLNGPISLTGVLRHELGHVLGLRHEHVHAAQATTCQPEPDDWRQVTPYDPLSVMHYPWCAGQNAGDFALSVLDRQGIASIYGIREICDGTDNDLNGAIDDGGICPAETCGNGRDDNFNGTIDEECETCNDIDDDGDGQVDEGCPKPEACNDVDDDLDGAIDEGVCPHPEKCNSIDDDLDGAIDEEVCPRPEECNGIDDDLNGTVDDLQACHSVMIYMSSIDDDAYVWEGRTARRNSEAVCAIDLSKNGPNAECNLSGGMMQRGKPESRWFVLKIGNGGCWNSGGTIQIDIDGRRVFEHVETHRVRHCGWIYRLEFEVNFKLGTFSEGPIDQCIAPGSCAD